jgi:hypothetical protein
MASVSGEPGTGAGAGARPVQTRSGPDRLVIFPVVKGASVDLEADDEIAGFLGDHRRDFVVAELRPGGLKRFERGVIGKIVGLTFRERDLALRLAQLGQHAEAAKQIEIIHGALMSKTRKLSRFG